IQALEQRLQIGVGAANTAEYPLELFLQNRAKVLFLRGLQPPIVEKWREASDERGAQHRDPFDARPQLPRLEDERLVEPTFLSVESGAKRPNPGDSAIERALFLAERPFRGRSDRQRSIGRLSRQLVRVEEERFERRHAESSCEFLHQAPAILRAVAVKVQE